MPNYKKISFREFQETKNSIKPNSIYQRNSTIYYKPRGLIDCKEDK